MNQEETSKLGIVIRQAIAEGLARSGYKPWWQSYWPQIVVLAGMAMAIIGGYYSLKSQVEDNEHGITIQEESQQKEINSLKEDLSDLKTDLARARENASDVRVLESKVETVISDVSEIKAILQNNEK